MLQLDDGAPDGPYLRACERQLEDTERQSLAERVLSHLRDRQNAVRLDAIRAALRVRMQSVVDTLRDLEQDGRVSRTDSGWHAAAVDSLREPGETEAGSAEEQPAQG